jgi:site-specific DNA-methyltransferase (adenine-specific)
MQGILVILNATKNGFMKSNNINFHNADCMEFMKQVPDKFYSLALVDPPYGIDVNINMGRRKGDKKSNYHKFEGGDKLIPSKQYFKQIQRISANQIIWGGNYFNSSAKKYDFNAAANTKRIHPTQKPVALYEWLLSKYAKPNDKIIDTHGGSGSIAIAVDKANTLDNTNYSLDIIELDKDYFDASLNRFNKYKSQTTLNLK